MNLEEISLKVQEGRAPAVEALVNQALEEGVTADVILKEGLLAGMTVVGERFKQNQVFIPEVLMAARAMSKGTELLRPHLAGGDGASVGGKVCIGTVQGDLHDIGKNLCKMMLEGKGLDVVDLGVDVPAEKFVSAVRDQGCRVVCLSALLTTTMEEMKNVIKALEDAGLRDKVSIMIGGAPVSKAFGDSIGADIYTSDAASCAEEAARLFEN